MYSGMPPKVWQASRQGCSCQILSKSDHLRLLSSNSSGGVLGLDDVIPDSSHANLPRTTREVLVEKHLLGNPAP